MASSDIVTFGIPLMARSVAQNWERIEHQLSATVGSIYNQTDPNFRIIIACTDKPDLKVATDERLEFVICEQIPPVDHTVFITDAARKRCRIAQRLRQLGGGYLMFADADDLISSKLVAYVRATAHPNGYSVKLGYMFDAVRGWLAPFPFAEDERFDWESHTSAVLTFSATELPAHDTDYASRYWNLIAWGHPVTRPRAEAEGRPLLDIPFRAAVYVRNTGENVSTREAATTVRGRAGFQAHLDDELETQRIRRTPGLDAEFNLKAAEAPPSAARSMREFRPLVGVSVVIATHRRAAGLRRLLTALRPQIEGHPDRDVVVVNDGSHDDAYAQVVAEFRDIIAYEALPAPAGVVVARNTGVGMCRAAYAVFTDDDCEPPPWWLDWLVARLRLHPETDVVVGTTKPLWNRKNFRERLGEVFLPRPSRVGKREILVTANAAIRTELLQAIGGFGFPNFSGTGEDTEISVRLYRAGARFARDQNWWVRHTVGDSVLATARRYRRYGEGHAHMGASAAVQIHAVPGLQLSQLGRISSLVPLARRRMHVFEGGILTRTTAAFAAAIVDWAYFRGFVRPRPIPE